MRFARPSGPGICPFPVYALGLRQPFVFHRPTEGNHETHRCSRLASLLVLCSVGMGSVCDSSGIEGQVPRGRSREVQVQEGLEFPPEYVRSLPDEIVKEFGASKTFAQALLPGQSPANATSTMLRLTGTVTYFDPGNRGKRYIGFGLGAGQIVAQITYQDRATGQTLVSDQITATFSGGVFGGDASGINREFAKTLATTTKLLLEKSAPASGNRPLQRPPLIHQALTESW